MKSDFTFSNFPEFSDRSLGADHHPAGRSARKRDEIQTLGHRYGARRIRVFGSVARREEHADSDVDFLVDFPRGYDLFAQRMPLTDQLALLLQRPVEVIPEHELNRHIREQVLREVVDL